MKYYVSQQFNDITHHNNYSTYYSPKTMMKERKKLWLNGDLYLFSYSVIFNFFVIMYFPANNSVVEIKYCI